MKAVYKRELHSYFSSMTGYVFIAGVVAFIGFYFMDANMSQGYPYFAFTLENISAVFVFMVPILTMKSIAEEKKTKTDQMLLTYPVSVTSVVVGKFLSMMTVFLMPLLISCLCPLIIAANGVSYILGDYLAILAVFCMGFLLVSIGMFISSLTENQLIAAVISLVTFLIMYLWEGIIGYIPETAITSMIGLFAIVILAALVFYAVSHNQFLSLVIGLVGCIIVTIVYIFDSSLFIGLINKILGAFSIMGTLHNFTRYNTFDFGGIFLYFSLAALFIFLTVQSVQKRRWS